MSSPEVTDTNLDYVKLLEEELDSCCKPQVTDLAKASVEDIVRDVHRVLTGNGDATHGLIFKLAATNVNVKLIKQDLVAVNIKANKQEAMCKSFRAKTATSDAIAEAEKTMLKKLGKMVWDNKTIIFILIFTAVMYFNNITGNSSAAAVMEQRLDKLINAKIEHMVVGKLIPDKPSGKK